MTYYSQLLLYYLLHRAGSCLEGPGAEYAGVAEEAEATELAQFVKGASASTLTPPPPRDIIRITRGYRIYIGERELKLRPMAKAVLLLFLRHPEGIQLKEIGDHREELTRLYSRVARTDDAARISRSIARVLDIFSNELNVNLSRVNSALSALENEGRFHIDGPAGAPKTLKKVRVIVIWE
ncbi:MAG: hypothetical protein IJU21_06550 [Bacteroidales bacterium]|nr:hypothetical protein [Bacteroidales bacterium]